MDLSAEQFIEAVTGSVGDPQEHSRDQRKQPRVGLRSRATIIPLSESSSPTPVSIQIRDLSSSGIGFLHDRKMSLDEQFALVLPRNGDTPSVILCSVAFWQPLARDLFAVGARFVRILRDGGDPPLPVQVEVHRPALDLATEIQQLHRQAG